MKRRTTKRIDKARKQKSNNKLVYKRTDIDKSVSSFSINKLYYPLIFISIAGILYLIFFSGVFKVTKVNIEGTREISKKQIKSDVESDLDHEIFKKNILLFDTDNEEINLKKKYTLKSLRIKKQYPDTINLKLEEYIIKLEWLSNHKYYLVDEKGKVVGPTDKKRKNLPVVTDKKNLPVQVGKSLVTSEFINFIDYLNRNFTKDTGAQISKIEINESFNEITIYSNLGFYIIFDTARDPVHELTNLTTVLNSKEIKGQKLTYLDMRINNKVFYK